MRDRGPWTASALLLGLILAGHALLWWLHPFDFLDEIDSQHYARIAAEILEGKFTLTAHPFYDRLGVTVPTATIYGLLGVSSRTTTLWTLLASLLTIVAVFATTSRICGRRAGLLAAFLLAANPIQVEYTPHLLPDIIASAFMVAAAALLYWARDVPAGASSRTWLRGSLCALTLFAGLLVKKTSLWAFLFFAAVLAVDLVRRRNLRLWAAIVATGTVLLGLFCLSYYLATGNPFRVITSIEKTHNLSPLASFYGETSAEYFHRLTLEPLQFAITQLGYGYLLVFAVAVFLALVVRPSLSLPGGVGFWAGYTAIVLACFWLGTTSLRSYNPLPVSARHMIPLVAPLAILGGMVLGAFLSDDERGPLHQLRIPAIVATLAAAAGALWWSLPNRFPVYALLGLTLIFLGWPAGRLLQGRIGRLARLAIVAAVPLALLFHYEAREAVKKPNPLRVLQRRFVRMNVGRLPPETVVFTDQHSAFVIPLLLEYRDRQDRFHLVDWNDEAAVRAHAGAPGFLFLDQTTLSMMNEWFGREIPWFAPQPPPHWPRLARRATRWQGSGPDRSDRPFPIAWIALLRIDEPTELLGR